MKTLKFTENLVPLVLSGKKYTTWRLFDDKNIQEGDEIDFVNASTKETFAHAYIAKVIEKPMSQVKDEDFEGHDKYNSNEQMYKTYSDCYHQSVGPDTVIKIIWFELVQTK